jgi:hypothetical protein
MESGVRESVWWARVAATRENGGASAREREADVRAPHVSETDERARAGVEIWAVRERKARWAEFQVAAQQQVLFFFLFLFYFSFSISNSNFQINSRFKFQTLWQVYSQFIYSI